MTRNQKNVSLVEGHLAQQPHLLDAFRICTAIFASRSDLAVAVSGSLVSGRIDQYSDLDFEILTPSATFIPEVAQWIGEKIQAIGTALAKFPATHIGMPNLHVHFFHRHGSIVKVDVWIKEKEDAPKGHVLWAPDFWDSEWRADTPGTTHHQPFDARDHAERLIGWSWYTFTKLARGESFEAFDSLHCMRSKALLPCLQFLYQQPFEGYRYAERRLPTEEQLALVAGVPASLETRELLRCLFQIQAHFRRAYEKMPQCDESVLHRLTTMTQHIAALPVPPGLPNPNAGTD